MNEELYSSVQENSFLGTYFLCQTIKPSGTGIKLGIKLNFTFLLFHKLDPIFVRQENVNLIQYQESSNSNL